MTLAYDIRQQVTLVFGLSMSEVQCHTGYQYELTCYILHWQSCTWSPCNNPNITTLKQLLKNLIQAMT
jgi:hypothetical protein